MSVNSFSMDEDVYMSQISEDVRNWVNRWLENLIKEEIISKSMKLAYKLLEICNYTRKFHANAVLEMVMPEKYKSIWLESSAYILYLWEAMVNHLRLSIILALSALYNPAFTLLRNTLELVVKGSFYESLAQGKYKEKWVLPSDAPESRLVKKLTDRLKIEPKAEEKLKKNTAHIFDLLREPLYTLHLKFSNITFQIINWDILYPLKPDEAFNVLNDLYSELSSNVHEHPDKTDVGRFILEKGELGFEPKPLKQSLEDFLKLWIHVVDVATLISINVFRSKRKPEEVKEILSKLAATENFKHAEITLTRKLFSNLGIQTPK